VNAIVAGDITIEFAIGVSRLSDPVGGDLELSHPNRNAKHSVKASLVLADAFASAGTRSYVIDRSSV